MEKGSWACRLFVAAVAGAMICAAWAQHSSESKPPLAVAGSLVDETALAGLHDVELQGDFAFVAGKSGSVAIIEVADPARPRIIWSQRDARTFEVQ